MVKNSSRHTGRDDRATTENVMDPRTRFILYQMLNRGQLKEMNGCISTGKEVVVTAIDNGVGECVSRGGFARQGIGNQDIQDIDSDI